MAEKFVFQLVIDVNGKSAKSGIKSVVDTIRKELNQEFKIKLDFPNSKSVSNRLSRMTRRLQTFNSELQRLAKFAPAASAGIASIAGSTGVATEAFKDLRISSSQANKVIQGTASVVNQGATAMERLGAQTALTARRYAGFVVASRFLFGFERALESAIAGAIEFNTELVKVAQVTNLPIAAINGLKAEIFSLGAAFATPVQDLNNAAKILSQAGFSLGETRQLLKSIAPTTLGATFGDITETVDGLIAILNQFNIAASKSAVVLDTLNVLAAKYPAEVSDIIEITKRAGAVFASSSGVSEGLKDSITSFQELAAIGTAVRSTTRLNAAQIGTSLKTIFSRIQNPEVLQDLRALGVELTDTKNNFVGPLEALKRLDQRLQGVSKNSVLFADIANTIGGLRQIDKTIALLSNLELVMSALGDAQSDANVGSVLKDANVALQDIGNQYKAIKQQFAELINSVISSQTFQKISSGLLTAASLFLEAGKIFTPFIPILGAFTAGKTIVGIYQFAKGFKQNILFLNTNTQALHKNTAAILGMSRNLGLRTIPLPTKPVKRASGGMVRGPGGSRSDSILTAISNGEYVIKADAVKKVGLPFLNTVNKGEIPKFADGGYTKFVAGANNAFDLNLRPVERTLDKFEQLIVDVARGMSTQLKFLVGRRVNSTGGRIGGFARSGSSFGGETGFAALINSGNNKSLLSVFYHEMSHALGLDSDLDIKKALGPERLRLAGIARGAPGDGQEESATAVEIAAVKDKKLFNDLNRISKSDESWMGKWIAYKERILQAINNPELTDNDFSKRVRAPYIPNRRNKGKLNSLIPSFNQKENESFESLSKKGRESLTNLTGDAKRANNLIQDMINNVNNLDELELVISDAIFTKIATGKGYNDLPPELRSENRPKGKPEGVSPALPKQSPPKKPPGPPSKPPTVVPPPPPNDPSKKLIDQVLSSKEKKRFDELIKRYSKEYALYGNDPQAISRSIDKIVKNAESIDDLENRLQKKLTRVLAKTGGRVDPEGVPTFFGRPEPRGYTQGPISPYGNTTEGGFKTPAKQEKLIQRLMGRGLSYEEATRQAGIAMSGRKRAAQRFFGSPRLGRGAKLLGAGAKGVGKILGGVGIGALAGLAIDNAPIKEESPFSILKGVAGGALTGGFAGSFVGGPFGTAIGALGGAIVGAVSSFNIWKSALTTKEIEGFQKALNDAKTDTEKSQALAGIIGASFRGGQSGFTFTQGQRQAKLQESFGQSEGSIQEFADLLFQRAKKAGAGSLAEYLDKEGRGNGDLSTVLNISKFAQAAGIKFDISDIVDKPLTQNNSNVFAQLSTKISETLNFILVRELKGLSKNINVAAASLQRFSEATSEITRQGLGEFGGPFRQVSIGTGSTAEIYRSLPGVQNTVLGSLLESRDIVNDELNGQLLRTATGNPEDLRRYIDTLTKRQGISATLRNSLRQQTKDVLAGSDDLTSAEKFTALQEVLQNFVDDPVFDAAQQVVQDYVNLVNQQNSAIQQNIDAYLQLVNAQRQNALDAVNIRADNREFGLRFTQRFPDNTAAIGRARGNMIDRFRTLFPNVNANSPAAIGAQIAAERNRLNQLSQDPVANATEIRTTQDKLGQLVNALKFVRDSVDELTAVETRLAEINQGRENAVSFARRIATASPEELAQINSQINGLRAFEGGAQLGAGKTAGALDLIDQLLTLDNTTLAGFGRSKEELQKLQEDIIRRRFAKVTTGGNPILAAFANGPGQDKESQDLLKRGNDINNNRANAAGELGKIAGDRIADINLVLNQQLKLFEQQKELLTNQLNNINRLDVISERLTQIPTEIAVKVEDFKVNVNFTNGQFLNEIDPLIKKIVREQIEASLKTKNDQDLINGK